MSVAEHLANWYGYPYLSIWVDIVKTTIEISDELANAAKEYAARHKLTLRSLVERGLREVLRVDLNRAGFKLKDASVGGQGLQAEYRDADWSRIREAVYKERGS